MTLAAQITKPRTRFNLSRVVLVGDRGMITDARPEADVKPAGLDWITALRPPSIRELAAEGGPLQLSLFDQRDMAEITADDYPGERLVVCRNPDLAARRCHKRQELLGATEQEPEHVRGHGPGADPPVAAEIRRAAFATLAFTVSVSGVRPICGNSGTTRDAFA
jgi:hypothetical protein